MNYRTNPKNGDQLSVLGFGCMRLPMKQGNFDTALAEQLIISAIEQGVNYFDTAYIYQNGKNETFLGSVLAKGYRDRVKIATKLPAFMVKKNADLDRLFSKHLERLQTDYIDYYLIHMLTDMGLWERLCAAGVMEWIAAKKATGQIRNIGFSFHGVQDQFIRLVDAYDWDFCQIQYNYMDEYNQAGTAGLRHAAEKGLPIIIMEPLRGGKLVTHLPREVEQIWHDAQPVRSPAEWGLRWVWNHPEATVVLSGMSDEAQLAENLRIAGEITNADAALKTDDLALFDQVRQILAAKMKVPCTACGYCMPCPYGVDIPACFALYNDEHANAGKKLAFKYMRDLGAMTAHPAYASLCVKCGKCEQHCPQSIKIRQELDQVARDMEGPLFKPVAWLGRKFMGVK